jgi:hypothetical protein
VYSDVERQGAASINLFDAEGRSLGQYHAPVRSDPAGFSFVGVVFEAPIVAQVEITSGQPALGAGVQDLSDGGNLDLARDGRLPLRGAAGDQVKSLAQLISKSLGSRREHRFIGGHGCRSSRLDRGSAAEQP